MRYFILFSLFLAFVAPLAAQSLYDSLYNGRRCELYFATGKADLDAAALASLDSVLTFYKQINTQKKVRITAHTDSVGRAESNEALSQRRAAAVKNWLLDKGLQAESIIEVKTLGERQPAASNATEMGRQRNRRATVEVARTVPMAVLEGRVTDKTNGKGVEALVVFRSKTRADSTRTDTSGRYRVRVPKDSVLKVEAVAQDFFFESFALKVLGSPELYQRYKVSPNIQLPPAKAGEKVVIRNLFFVGDQANLLAVSEPELPKILRFMELNADLIIEIGGHVNVPYPKNHKFVLAAGQTAEDYAMQREPKWKHGLSLQRAETVRDYLLKNGIASARIVCVGYKNTQMLFPHAATLQEQEQNRRVEIKVLGKTK